jgi:hypothetical protein
MEEILVVVLGVALYLLWLLLAATCKFIIKIVSSIWNDLTGETARGKIREENARKEEEERKQRERERQQKHQQAERKKREQFYTENSEVFAGIAYLLSTCGAPTVEIMRALGAITGTGVETEPKMVIWAHVGCILASFSRTDSTGNAYIETLWEEVTRTIKPPDVDGAPPLSVFENFGVKQPEMVSLLVEYDKRRGTTLSSKAASAYLSIVSAVSSHFWDSLAAKMVADKYAELLSPYIHESGGNGYAGSSKSSAGGNSNRRSVCRKCIEDYGLLGLPVGASKNEIGQRKRDCAEVLHRDKLVEKSERVRNAAEQQLKIVNTACDRILRCRCAYVAS